MSILLIFNAQNTLQHFKGAHAPPCPCLLEPMTFRNFIKRVFAYRPDNSAKVVLPVTIAHRIVCVSSFCPVPFHIVFISSISPRTVSLHVKRE